MATLQKIVLVVPQDHYVVEQEPAGNWIIKQDGQHIWRDCKDMDFDFAWKWARRDEHFDEWLVEAKTTGYFDAENEE